MTKLHRSLKMNMILYYILYKASNYLTLFAEVLFIMNYYDKIMCRVHSYRFTHFEIRL